MIWISAISLIFLILIALSDFKNRQIPIAYLLGETIVSFCLGYSLIGVLILKCAVTNFMIITFQILILWGYIKIEYHKSDKSLWAKFGKGDVFMLAISALNLSALNYLLFIILMSFMSLIIWSGFIKMWKISNSTIPFAGFIAIGLMILRILMIIGCEMNFYSDNYILNSIYGIY